MKRIILILPLVLLSLFATAKDAEVQYLEGLPPGTVLTFPPSRKPRTSPPPSARAWSSDRAQPKRKMSPTTSFTSTALHRQPT